MLKTQGVPKIFDFGITSVKEDFEDELDPITGKFSCRWFAYELMQYGVAPTYASDCWAWGMICVELYTMRMPYYECMRETEAGRNIRMGVLPEHPPTLDNDVLWDLMVETWTQDSTLRPNASEITARIGALYL